MQRTGDIALAGAPNVGKSSLLNALIGEHLAIVSPKAQATRLPVVGLRTDGDTQFIFHDLPGLLEPAYLLQRRMRAAALESLHERLPVPAQASLTKDKAGPARGQRAAESKERKARPHPVRPAIYPIREFFAWTRTER